MKKEIIDLENVFEKHKNFYVDEVLGMFNKFIMSASWAAKTTRGKSLGSWMWRFRKPNCCLFRG